MHILLIRNLNPFYENSADANRFIGIIKGLLRNGIKVTMLITDGYGSKSEIKTNGTVIQYPDLYVYYTRNLRNYNIWLKRFNKYIVKKLTKNLILTKLKKFIGGDYDYVWLTNNAEILYAFNCNSELIKGKTVIELNEFNDIYKEQGATNNIMHNKIAIQSEQIFCDAIGKIDCFVIMTKTLMTYYKKMAKHDAHFLHMPMTVDFSRFENYNKTCIYKKPYIAYAGTFNNSKDGVDILIRSFALIAKQYPRYHLYMAGYYHYDVEMQKKLIRELKLDTRITYLGVLNKEEIPSYLMNASVTVLPRPDSHQARGGFPTKLGEYLATGNPVCATKVGEIPDYLKDNESAFLAIPGNTNSFTDALQRALSDRKRAEEVGMNGKKVAEQNFNIETQIKFLIEFLRNNM